MDGDTGGELDMGSMVDDLSSSLGFGSEGSGNDDIDALVDGAVRDDAGDRPAGTPPGGAPVVGDGKSPDGKPIPVGEDPAAGAPAPKPAGAADPANPAGAPAPGPDAAPKTWRPEAAAEWAALSPTVKAEIAKREEDMFRGIEGFKEDASWGKGVKSVLAPFAAIMQQHNIDPMVQIGGLMNAHYSLATGSPQAKADLIAKLLVDYKVDPTLVKVGDAPGEAPYVDPEVKALRESVQALQSTEATRQKENETRVRAELATKIDSFFADPANTYINEVGHDMARLIDSGLAKDTADAYQQAIWLNPAVRAKEQARITTEAATKVETERAAKAEAARKASAANVNARAKSGSTAAPLGTMEDTMMATLRDIKTR